MKILLIEDNAELAKDTNEYLSSYGYLTETANTFGEAAEKIDIYDYDMYIVDIGLPDGSGLELIEPIKLKKTRSGIIIVTARNSVEDRIRGLDIGADDYLIKPFHKEELNARIRSILRRNKFDSSNEINFNEIKIDLLSGEVMVGENEIILTKKEYDLLLYFIDNKNKIITKESIAEHLWGDHYDQYDNFDFIYNHIKNLRRKILNSGGKDYIQSMYGMGYKFNESLNQQL